MDPPVPAPAAPQADTQRALTYSRYLRLEELLDLQQPRSDPPEHDELLFIVIHQVYELWFKVLLHELDRAGADLSAGRLYEAIATFKRCRMIMKTLVAQIDILETMTPLSFGAFRDRLESASGFQSAQFRELEFLLGRKRPQMLRYYEPQSVWYARLERRLREPSLVHHFYRFLAHLGVEVPEELWADPARPVEPCPPLQEALLALYRERPDVRILLELMTDFDEGLQEWRYRHVKMVERTIGQKTGTGGSAGAAFLRTTLFQPVFPDLWALRDQL